MDYEYFTTNDGARIAYQTSISLTSTTPSEKTGSAFPSTCILLLHGFSGSSSYFNRNTKALSEKHWLITPDMRGHGRSQHTRQGYHVARLAMDVHELIKIINGTKCATRIYAVGCSIGAAVLWTYTELFTDSDFAGLIFVDQAPLQDRSMFDGWGPDLAHYGCYDEATTLQAQQCWASQDVQVREHTYVDLVASCLGYRYKPLPEDGVSEEQKKEDEAFFTKISRSCDGVWLARLLSFHTRYDHREAIGELSKPVLMMAGKRSGCFSIDGMMETVRRANGNKDRSSEARGIVFESGHWLFWEEPDRFNRELLNFVDECRRHGTS